MGRTIKIFLQAAPFAPLKSLISADYTLSGERFPFPSLSLSPPKTFAFIESLLAGFPADGMPGVLFWGRAFFQGSGAVLAGWRNMEKGLVEPPCAVDKGGCFRAL